jgi:ribosomal protein S18 acetylase RimI-like enzyme
MCEHNDPVPVVRRAQSDDLEAAVALIAAMFVDLGTTEIPPSWQRNAEHALRTRPEAATFVTVDGDRVVAVAVGLVEQRLPSPRRPDGRIGYVEWLSTASSDRRRGAARLAMEALMGWYREQGLKVVDVHASTAASPLYRQLGFSEPQSTSLRRIM